MASSIYSLASTSAMLLVLVFLCSTSRSDVDIPPSLSPFLDNLCDEVTCGRGNCSVDDTKPFNFICKCDPGWLQTTHSENQDHLQFLPCVVPNCSFESCMLVPPPPAPSIPDNVSFFDPCYWTYCGEGTCNRDHTTFKHTCNCNPGYTNLMNISQFPCISSCAIGPDCRRLGVRPSDATTRSTTDDSSQGIRFPSGSFHCIGVIVMSLALINWF
ncbi:hypothetical protein R6Q59_034488 [Mikania micrantha]